MICPRCDRKIEDNLAQCPECGCILEDRAQPSEAKLPNIKAETNNILNPKFLVVLLIAVVIIVILKNIFFKNVENMPKYKMDYSQDINNSIN